MIQFYDFNLCHKCKMYGGDIYKKREVEFQVKIVIRY